MRAVVGTAMLGCAMLAGTPAAAGQAAAGQAVAEPASPAALDEIIVTAQRRAERLLDVPVSVVSTTGERLQQLNLTAATDLQFVTPGFALGDANTPRGAGLRIRGIGTNVFADGIEQSVGTVVDGVPYARAGQGLADLADVERVEVLRGPQGLLFGRNASAGVINIVTRKPGETLSAVANASYGSDDEVKLSGAVSGPLGEGFGIGVSGYLNRQDGFVRNVRTGQEINDRNEYGLRGVLRATPTDALELLLRGDWSRRDNDCCVWTVRQFASAATDPRPGQVFLRQLTGPIASGPDALENNAGAAYSNRVTSRGASGEINIKLGDYTVTSLTAYRRWDQGDNNDADLSPFNVLDRNFGANELKQFSQELRLTSPADQTVSFVAGLFHFNSRNTSFTQQAGRFVNSFALAGAAGVNIPLAPGLALPAAQLFGRDITSVNRVRDHAAFGQATVNLSDSFAMIAGGRVTRTRVSVDFTRAGTAGANAFNFLVGAPFAPLAFDISQSDTDFSWRLGAQWKPDADTNLYASVARGYKGPGYNTLADIVLPVGRTPQEAFGVSPEIPTAYELGYKASLLERRVSLALAVFRTDFKDFQAQIFETATGAALGSFVIRNAGKLRTQGAELQLTARPADSLTLDFGVAYNDARFIRFAGAACPRLGVLVTTAGAPCGPTVAGGPNATAFDASGLRATNAPRWSGNFGFRFDAPGEGPVRPFAQANIYARSATIFGLYPANIPNPTVQGAYAVVNGSVGASLFDGRVTAAVFARNLFDQNYVTSIFDLPFDSAGGLGQFVTRDASRTLGVQINLRY